MIDNDWEYNREDYLTIKKSRGSSCIITSTFRKQNINLLLTCHQAFREGYGIYQSLHAQATFICPTGPLEDTQAVIKSLKPAETTSVRFASMHMSIADVGTHVYQELVQGVEDRIDVENVELTDAALLVLTDIMRRHWHGKLLLIRNSFPALEVLHLVKDELCLAQGPRRRYTYKQLALFLEGAAGTTQPLLADPGSESWDDVECRLIAYGDWGSQNRFDGGPLSEYLEFHEKTEVDATLRENAREILEELSAQLPKLRKI